METLSRRLHLNGPVALQVCLGANSFHSFSENGHFLIELYFFLICVDFEKRGVPTGINCGIDIEQLRGSPSITIDAAALTESNYTFTVTATQMGKGHFTRMLMITHSYMTHHFPDMRASASTTVIVVPAEIPQVFIDYKPRYK